MRISLLLSVALTILQSTPVSANPAAPIRPANSSAAGRNVAAATVDLSFTASLLDAHAIGVTSNGCVLVRSEAGKASGGSSQFLWLKYDGLSGAAVPLPAGASVLAVLPDGHLIASHSPYFYQPNGSAAAFTLPDAFDSSAALTAVAVQRDGCFLLAQGARLARLYSDGSPDPTFHYAPPRSEDASITHLEVDRRGNVYTTLGRERPAVFRLNASGSPDPEFLYLAPGLKFSTGTQLSAHPLNDGRVLLVESNAETCRLSVLSAGGAPDPAWTGPEALIASGRPVIDGDGFIIFAAAGCPVRRYTISATGLTDEVTLAPDDGMISDYVILPDGKLVMSGTFTSWAGHTTSGVARLLTRSSSGAHGDAAACQVLRDLKSTPTAGRWATK